MYTLTFSESAERVFVPHDTPDLVEEVYQAASANGWPGIVRIKCDCDESLLVGSDAPEFNDPFSANQATVMFERAHRSHGKTA